MSDRIKSFVIGVAAGSIAIAFSFFLRIFTGGLFIPELASQALFSLTPGEFESQSVEALGSIAKYSAFIGAIAVNLFIYGLLGVLLHRTYRRLGGMGYVVNALRLSLVPYSILFALAIILLETTEVLTQPLSIQLAALYFLPPHITFGLILYYSFGRQVDRLEIVQQQSPAQESSINLRRREFLRLAAGGVIVSAAALVGGGLLLPKPERLPEQRAPEQARPLDRGIEQTKSASVSGDVFADPALAPLVASEVTLNDLFYKVDTNILTPVVNANSWKLNVKGLLNNPLKLTYEELKSLPAIEEYATLECISNKLGDDLISTALWKGVALKSILEKAQVRPEATYIVFRCYDGYDVGIPLERGLLEGTILAYEMNNVPLPAEHGFPLRAIVPGIYGMMNAKWITEIELVDKTYEGFWQRKGWSNNAEYQTHSTIILPEGALESRFGDLRSSRIVIGDKVPIAGIAFAGDRGISKVEVSLDGGNSWETAKIKEPLSDYTWVMWSIDWNPQTKGRYSIAVRATDKTGKVQTAELQNPFPSGSTGYHTVDITVEAPN